MDISLLEKNLKEEKLNSLYLLYGEERFLLESSLNKIQKIFGEKISGINFITLDSSNVTNIISDIQTPAFGYEKKLIIVRDSDLMKKKTRGKKESGKPSKKDDNSEAKKIADYINENIEDINSTCVIVFVENEIDKNDLYKAIEKNGIV